MGHEKVEYPQAQNDTTVYEFSSAELAEVQKHVAKYPEKQSAVMPVLWMAQEKYGWLSNGAIQLVADTLGLSFATVYGVATFYTMYLKRPIKPGEQFLLEICTCFSCGECNGDKLYEYARKKLNCKEDGMSADGKFWLREAECLGACDTAPVMQVHNKTILHNLTEATIDQVIDGLRNGVFPKYQPVPLIDQSKI